MHGLLAKVVTKLWRRSAVPEGGAATNLAKSHLITLNEHRTIGALSLKPYNRMRCIILKFVGIPKCFRGETPSFPIIRGSYLEWPKNDSMPTTTAHN